MKIILSVTNEGSLNVQSYLIHLFEENTTNAIKGVNTVESTLNGLSDVVQLIYFIYKF